MAIVASERTGIQKLVIAMFNAAPGGLYLNEFTGYYEGAAGRSLGNLANILGQSTVFQALYPSFQTATEFATAILTPYGLQANQESIDFVTSKFATTSKAQIALQVGVAIDSSTSTNAALVNAKAILTNKAAVSEQFSVVSNSQITTLAGLQNAISQVTAATSSIATQNTANASGSTTVAGISIGLTVGADFISPTQANSAFKSSSGNDTFIATTANSLETVDNIDGGDGIDTLNATYTVAATYTPILKSVEIINLTNTTAGATFSLASATGVTALNNTSASTVALILSGVNLTTATGLTGSATTTFAEATTVNYAGATGTNDSATINATAAVQTAGKALTVAAIENLTLTSSGTSTLSSLAVVDAKSIVVTGTSGTLTVGTDASSNFTALSTFNASGFTGTMSFDFNTGTKSTVGMTYTGGVGTTTLVLSTTNTVFDTLVYNAANSSTISRLTTVTNFNTAGDKLDVKAFALGADTTVGATSVAVAGDIAGFFTGTNRVLLNAGTTTVYVDSNKDGNFNAGTDLAIVLTGATALNFTAADLTLA